MTPTAWRIVKRRWAKSAFTGAGAELYGGRWSPPGVAVVYLAATVALAKLEVLVHTQSSDLLDHYLLFPVEFDQSAASVPARLPRGWRDNPAPANVQAVGERWVRSGVTPILRVPSVLAEGEFNFLFNPRHPRAGEVRIGKSFRTRFDPRLKDG